MKSPIRILLQTTIPATADDWHVGRFSLLSEHLSSLKDGEGHALCEITARDRETNDAGDDEILSRLDATDFDELWLFAVDAGDGLTEADCRGITRFRQRGGGILSTREIGAEYDLPNGSLMPIGLLVLTASPMAAARLRCLSTSWSIAPSSGTSRIRG